jgi:phenylacetate-CoA ligase
MTLTVARSAVADKYWLGDLVRAATEQIPFYRAHLENADTSTLVSTPTFNKRMTAGYGQFPLTTGGPTGAYRVMATSGTTGERLYVAFGRADWERCGRWLEHVGRQVALSSHDVLLNTHCYGLWVGGPVLDLLAQRSGACVVPLGPAAPAGVLHVLRGGVGTAISATPSYLRRVIEAAEASGFDLRATGLRVGFIGAEAAEPALRLKLLSHLPPGFRWVELYGLTETCGPSVACAPDPDVAELTVNTGDFRFEVLQLDADVPVSFGEVGELTITTLNADCRTPLIRYRTRDLVRVAGGEPSATSAISQILGRADDALKIGGILMYPSAVADILAEMLPATSEWRGVVYRDGLDDEMLIEVEAEPEMCDAIEVAFDERIGLSVAVVPAERGSLARSFEKTRRVVFETAEMSAETRAALLRATGRESRRSTCG